MSAVVLRVGDEAFDVLSGALSLPLQGVGEARLELSADAAPTGACELVVARDDGGEPTTFVGTIVFGAAFGGRARVTMALGAGHLEGPLVVDLAARQYVAAPYPVTLDGIVADIAADAGETLAAGVLDELAPLTVARWLRAGGTGASALRAVAPLVGGWRMLADGTLWVGAETWPAADETGLYQQDDDGDALAIEVAPGHAELRPGTTLGGRRITTVVYSFGGGLRATLYYAPVTLTDALRDAVAAVSPRPVYARAHGATVRVQREDDTIDVDVDTPEIGALTNVPLRCGIVGARVLVDDGTRVRVAFEDAEPSRPYAFGIDGDPAADKGIARVGDEVDLGSLVFAGSGTLTWTDPRPDALPPTQTNTIQLVGVIRTGSVEVMLRG